jgi:hypothetical protein
VVILSQNGDIAFSSNQADLFQGSCAGMVIACLLELKIMGSNPQGCCAASQVCYQNDDVFGVTECKERLVHYIFLRMPECPHAGFKTEEDFRMFLTCVQFANWALIKRPGC